MDFYFAGGAMEVGGSCIDLRTSGYHLVMDSGIRQGAGAKDPLPDFRGVQERGSVDAILVSHAHMDHTGSLPLLSRSFPAARIYMTGMTMELTRILLYDSLKLMAMREEELPQYTEEDVRAMLGRITPVRYQAETEILPGLKVTFYPAGHIAGAACIFVQGAEGSCFYSGDISGFAQQTIEGIGIPRLRPDVCILESTYGDRLHASRAVEEARLVELVARCVTEGKKILIPAFALGRSQEVLLILRRAFTAGQIPKVPVFVDGMIRDMNRAYTAHPTYLRGPLARRIMKGEEPFYTDEIRAVGKTEKREDLVQAQGPAVFVASSGMLMGGPSMVYAKLLMPREDAQVILTGYQDEESPGRLLLNLLSDTEAEKRVTIDGTSVPVRAGIEMVGLSAHADSGDLCGVADKLGSRHVILQHGSAEAVHALAEALSGDWKRRIYLPGLGEELDIPLRVKRKQRSRELPHTLGRETFAGEADAEALRQFCMKNYPAWNFTPEQLMKIWYGNGKEASEEEQEGFRGMLLESGCFDRNPRRLFLLRALTDEEAAEQKRKKEPSQHDVENFLRELLRDYEVRKFGLYVERKEAVLGFDFPDAVPEGLEAQWAKELEEALGWKLSVRETTNHQAVGLLLRSLFGERLGKVSWYDSRRVYEITVEPGLPEDKEKQAQFRETTGWQLVFSGADKAGKAPVDAEAGKASAGLHTEDDGWYCPPDGAEPMEQNQAFAAIDAAFATRAVRPYKKGKKNDSRGVYLELQFLSPALGRRCGEVLADLAVQLGWRLHIAESVNQAELFAQAGALCAEYGIRPAKNPAYLPGRQAVRVIPADGKALPEEMKEKFLEKTGIPMTE